jgi:hypothetical protein
MRWAGHIARIGDVRNAYNILVRKLEGKRPFGRPSRVWKDVRSRLGKCELDSSGSR